MRLLIVLVSCALVFFAYENDFSPFVVKPDAIPHKAHFGEGVVVKRYTRGNKSPYVVFGESYEVLPDSLGFRETGVASWYGKKFHGRLTSNGETYDMYKLSAAHRSLPLPTVVKVTNLENGKHVILTINDRGPFHGDRMIDLSFETATKLGFAKKGTTQVVVEALDDINYPDLQHRNDQRAGYLQVGVFTDLISAEKFRTQIDTLMVAHQLTSIRSTVLQSRKTTGILNKVWLGPIQGVKKRERIASIVLLADDLDTPREVELTSN